jgi:hypothetical protein
VLLEPVAGMRLPAMLTHGLAKGALTRFNASMFMSGFPRTAPRISSHVKYKVFNMNTMRETPFRCQRAPSGKADGQ